MSMITVAIPAALDSAVAERMKALGAHSIEEYLRTLVESDCAAGELEQILAARWDGPFTSLTPDWKARVRQAANSRGEA